MDLQQNTLTNHQKYQSLLIQTQMKNKKDNPKKHQTPEFVNTHSEDMNDEQEPAVKQPQKASKASEFVDTDTNGEQGQQPKKA